jgi:hypothetical protein
MSKNIVDKSDLTVFPCSKQMDKIINDLVTILDYCYKKKMKRIELDLRFLESYYNKKDFIEVFVDYYNINYPAQKIFCLNVNDLKMNKCVRLTFLKSFEKNYEIGN